MRLVWHIVKKDFRRLWWPLALWALLLVAKGEVGVRALASAGGEGLFYFTLGENTLVTLDVIVNLLLVAALVQEDILVGSSMFWATRPIAGGRLLAAKLLSAVLMFGVLPVLVSVRWWMVCDYGAAEMARAALEIADAQTVTVGFALLLAALAKNLNQLLAWLVGLSASCAVWVFWLARIVPWPHEEISRGVNETRGVLGLTLVVVGAAAAIAHQYITRRTMRTLKLVAALAGLFAMVTNLNWDFSSGWTRAPRTSVLTEGITVAVERVKWERPASIEYALRGVPELLGVNVEAEHAWRWQDGASAWAQSDSAKGSWPGRAEWRALGLAGARNDAAAQAYAAAGPEGPPKVEWMTVKLPLSLSPEKIARLQTEPATYTAVLHVGLQRPGLEFELPLRAGERREVEGFSVRIGRSEWMDGEWRGTVFESRPAFGSYRRFRPSLATLFRSPGDPAPGFALVNRGRGEAVKLWRNRGVQRVRVGAQELSWGEVRCRVPRDETEEKTGSPPRWLQGATLAAMRYREEAAFEREIKLERFELPRDQAASKETAP